MLSALMTVPASIVPLPVEEAFALFTEGMASWWPLATHSIFGAEAVSCVVEPLPGGRIYELSSTGLEGSWGRVLEWEPPHRFVCSWNPNPTRVEETELEVTFVADPQGGTRMDLEHRSWERLGAERSELHGSYQTGWDLVLGAFVERAGAGATG